MYIIHPEPFDIRVSAYRFLKFSKSRHYLMATVCVIAVSTNILAVSLSGIFTENPVTVNQPINGTQNVLPKIGAIKYSDQPFRDHFNVAQSNLSHNTTLPAWTDRDRYYIPFSFPKPKQNTSSGQPLLFQKIQGSTIGFGTDVTCSNLSSDSTGENSIFLRPRFDTFTNSTGIQIITTHRLSNGTVVKCIPTMYSEISPLAGDNPASGFAFDFVSTTEAHDNEDSQSNSFCPLQVIAGWIRSTNTTLYQGVKPNPSFTSTFVTCRPHLSVATYQVSIDIGGRIIDSKLVGAPFKELAPYISAPQTEENLMRQAVDLVTSYNAFSRWHNDTFTSDYINSLLGMKLKSNRLVNPAYPVPEPNEVVVIMQELYQLLFAINLGLLSDQAFNASSDSNLIQLQAVMTETRLFISPPMFKLTLVLLGLQLIVAFLYYSNRPKRFLPRMPTSIASIIAFVSASRALSDFDGTGNKAGEQMRYGYGRFVGMDGKTHVGIERQRNVVPLESENPDVRRRRWGWKGDEKKVKTWI